MDCDNIPLIVDNYSNDLTSISPKGISMHMEFEQMIVEL